MTKYVVTGATGHLGQRVVQELAQRTPATNITLGVHTPAKAQAFANQGMTIQKLDYQDVASVQAALQDADVVIYIPSKSHDSFSRVTELEHVLTAAQAAHVGHFLAMGFIADQADNPFDLSAFYGYLPRRLAETGLSYTILRNALYADPLVPYLPELIERQNVIYPMGDASLSFISLADSAAAFAQVAVTPRLWQQSVYTLTQERSYTMPALAAVLSQISGAKIGYAPVTLQQFSDLYNQGNEGHMLASMYAGGAQGLLATVTDDYHQIMGRSAQSLPDFLKASLATASTTK
ncbi:nucleoside-diphosphate-sugar epimerase [Levilactobacillus namurensis DSM 19117]|uniref:Nucleoside-diphosphate-sugar epimerase n=1 Tax=Levilactobacillus namurensis DSM 19117 TaxID=1423773 RepID=A0A0R1K069_9LACO|nr:SDR family oxidoreductase [Levilactobacillus namurensis]KRK74899.1 nucleoside-diphosphate-sugar epimerase [Levilactobacillus namurensis DSM 19117]GEO74497.1 NAD(P)-dependent oxidoreductase [Levilactobacillus namurensis]